MTTYKAYNQDGDWVGWWSQTRDNGKLVTTFIPRRNEDIAEDRAARYRKAPGYWTDTENA
jgi:hypothetical protein